jgi:hypothetical protein
MSEIDDNISRCATKRWRNTWTNHVIQRESIQDNVQPFELLKLQLHVYDLIPYSA